MSKLVVVIALLLTVHLANGATRANEIDVVNYSVTLEPDIADKSVKGTVVIQFLIKSNNLTHAELDCGDLTIDAVRFAGAPAQAEVKNNRLTVSLPSGLKTKQLHEIEINYRGKPKRGIRFFPDREQVHTIFSTSQWMVCVDDPADKATLTFRLILKPTLTPVANGDFVFQRDFASNKRVWEWRQKTPIPTYIFGFAVGPFHVVKEKRRNVELQYLATNYSAAEVRRIFRDTPDMLDFFERRAGVTYADRTYTQKHFGKSVVTTDFVAAMEAANGKSLETFFAEWVYLKSKPAI